MTDAVFRYRLPMPRELTLRVVLLGVVLSVVMGAANVYVGLKIGMTVSASIPAAAVAMLVFRAMRRRSILEANQVQTCASAGESLAAGIIFTMPALVMMEGAWTRFDYWTVTAIAFAGGTLGILFMIPMRKIFVVDNDELPYPEGVACAAVLETGNEEGKSAGALALAVGGLFGAVVKFYESFVKLVAASLEGVIPGMQRVFYFGGEVSPMLVAVGFIVRLNVAVLFFLGGALGWLVLMPIFGLPDKYSVSSLDAAWDVWDAKIRFIGVGAMVVGGVASIWAVREGLVQAVVTLKNGLGKAVDRLDDQRDLPAPLIAGIGILCVLITCGAYYSFTGDIPFSAIATVLMIIAGFFFTAVASYIVGLVGNSNSPVSGMTITAVLFAGAIFKLLGYAGGEGSEGAMAIIGVAGVVCCIACTSGDVCNDLKTGSLVGASPRYQQTMQLIGVAVAALVLAPVLNLLHAQEGIGSENLTAPQAGLFKSLAEGLMGQGSIPWDMVKLGAVIGAVVLAIDTYLKRSGAAFRAHLMPMAVGIYLPFSMATPLLVGGIIAYFVCRGAKDEAEVEKRTYRGVLFSSGVIAGEALTKLVLVGLATAGIGGTFLAPIPRIVFWITVGVVLLGIRVFWVWTQPEEE